jgi:diamine N-acetyltransferase
MNDTMVRRWTEADIPAVREITWETWVATYASFVPSEDLRTYFDDHYSPAVLRAFMDDPSAGGWIALVGGRPAAYVRHRFSEEEGRFYVMSLYVRPSDQGQGLGHRLMEASEREAAARGVDRVWLGVMQQNSRTIEWYRRMGFQFVEEAPFVMGNTAVNHYIGFRLLTVPPQS